MSFHIYPRISLRTRLPFHISGHALNGVEWRELMASRGKFLLAHSTRRDRLERSQTRLIANPHAIASPSRRASYGRSTFFRLLKLDRASHGQISAFLARSQDLPSHRTYRASRGMERDGSSRSKTTARRPAAAGAWTANQRAELEGNVARLCHGMHTMVVAHHCGSSPSWQLTMMAAHHARHAHHCGQLCVQQWRGLL